MQCECPERAGIPCDTSHLHAPLCAAQQLACGQAQRRDARRETRTLRKRRVKSSCFVWKDLSKRLAQHIMLSRTPEASSRNRTNEMQSTTYRALRARSTTPLHYPLAAAPRKEGRHSAAHPTLRHAASLIARRSRGQANHRPIRSLPRLRRSRHPIQECPPRLHRHQRSPLRRRRRSPLSTREPRLRRA